MSQITEQKTEIDYSHFGKKYGKYTHSTEVVSEYLTRHRSGFITLTDEELTWLNNRFESSMAEVVERYTPETIAAQRKEVLKRRDRLHTEFYHSKNKHVSTIRGHVEEGKNKEGEITVSRHYPSIFDMFCYIKPGEQEFFYTDVVTRTPSSDERMEISGDCFRSFGVTIAKRWFIYGKPHFIVLPDQHQGYWTTRGDISALRSQIFWYFPENVIVMPGFLINWAKDRKRRGSTAETPRYKFSTVQEGAFVNIEYKPDLIKMGSQPIPVQNTVEYHILDIDGEHFFYLDQSIERETTVLIHIPKHLRGHYKNALDLYVELTHPPEVNPKEPYFRHGEWYMVPSDRKTKDLIKCAGGPIEEGSDHYVDEIREDEDGNKYVRGNMRHRRGDHPLLKLGKKIWYRIFKSNAEGHSADMRGASVRYD